MLYTTVRCIAIAALALGCQKVSTTEPTAFALVTPVNTGELDRLWALAPQGATAGIIVSSRALAMAEHAWADVVTFAHTLPHAPRFMEPLESEIKAKLGTTTPTLSSLGLARDKGLAVFVMKGDPVIVMPVVDRDRWTRLLEGQRGDVDTFKDGTKCKPVQSVYACANDLAILGTLGQANLNAARTLAGQRGDIEVAGIESNTTFSFVGQLERGSLTVRGLVRGSGVSKVGEVGFGKSKFEFSNGAFAAIDVRPLVAKVASSVPDEIVAGVRLRSVVESLDGRATAMSDRDFAIQLKDPKPMATLIGLCGQLPGADKLGAHIVNGRCRIEPQALQMFGMSNPIEAYVDKTSLRISAPALGGGQGNAARSAMGNELARGEWSLVAWLRTSLFANTRDLRPLYAAASHGAGALPYAGDMLKVMATINELGIGFAVDQDAIRVVASVRTMWSNPDAVIAKLSAIPGDNIVNGQALEAAKSIANATPTAPLGNDLAAGGTGLVWIIGGAGVAAAVSIPAFVQYSKRAKASEASVQLVRIGNSAKRSFAEMGAFPKGTSHVLPANSTPGCCGLEQGKCRPQRQAFEADPVWKQLDFAIDEPTRYQYKYAGAPDGKSFVANAIGDLNCDGTVATFELRGSIENGSPVVKLVQPPSIAQ